MTAEPVLRPGQIRSIDNPVRLAAAARILRAVRARMQAAAAAEAIAAARDAADAA